MIDNTHALFPMARRLYGLIVRHLFLLRSSWPRIAEILYWPTINIVIWGFLNLYLSQQLSGAGLIATSLFGGVLLMEFMTRSQTGLLVSFLEEVWSRNLGNLFVTPMPPLEYALAMIVMSLLRVVFAMVPCLIMAYVFFDFWVPALGWSFLGFALSLAMTGWTMCFLMLALILRHGLAVEWFAWMASFLLCPLVGAYYPVTILPEWLQYISRLLPPTYIFEGMRSILMEHVVRPDLLLISFALNLVFLPLGLWVFHRAFEKTRQESGLLQTLE